MVTDRPLGSFHTYPSLPTVIPTPQGIFRYYPGGGAPLSDLTPHLVVALWTTRAAWEQMRTGHGLQSALIGGAILAIAAVAVVRTMSPPPLGPRDGEDLPPTEMDRVKVGDVAPDFTLESHSDGVITLSDYQRDKNVILVFYRGFW